MFSQYILILIWIGFMAIMSNLIYMKRFELVCGEKVERYRWLFAILIFVPIVWMAGNRGWYADTGAYITNYQAMPSSIFELPTYIANVSKDKGFSVLSVVLKSILGSDYTLYLMVLAVFQGASLVCFFRKYSSDYILSVFLFVASTDYLSWMFNGLRQFMAVTIILFATPLMLKKKYFSVICVILLASTMHQSALLMIPFVIIAQGEAWNKKTILFIATVLLAIVFVDQFTNILDDTLSATQYVNVVSDYTSWNDDGTNPLRVAVYSVPALLALLGRKQIRAEHNLVINFCTNMSIISMGLYLISMVTSGIFIGRLPIYCSLFGYILLPWEINNLFTKDFKIIAYIGVIGAYIVFYYYSIFLS